MFGAQFDDAATGESVILEDPLHTLIATHLDEVHDVLARAAEESRAGRWVGGYVSYDAAPAFDPAFSVPGVPSGPLAWFGVFGTAQRIAMPPPTPAEPGAYSVSRWMPTIEHADYEGAFKVVRDRIRDGDTYQVNLTFPMRAAFSGSAAALYGDLMAAQRSSYGAHLWHDATHVVSVSPEQFFSVDGSRIVTRPMKGTRPRGRWTTEDATLAHELEVSEKDRAENLMIVDLIRNDLGRIAQFGSVEVEELFSIERYPTVWQMTSQIAADLRQGTSLNDAFSALFPCGSVTGAPKARATEVITDVESHARGVYCGAIGFIPPGNGLDGARFNVAIRTATVNEEEGIAEYHVGGGVTWDSSPHGEYDEALAKALVLATREAPDGIFESIRWDKGYIWRNEHIARLEASGEHLGIEVPTEAINSALTELELVLDAPTKVRVAVDRTGPVRIDTSPAIGRFQSKPGPDDGPVVLAIDFDPIDRTDHRWFHKTTDRTRYVTRQRRHPDADEVILTNQDGNVTEGTITNIAALVDGQWLTPSVDDGLLAGVMRGALIDDGLIVEGSIGAAELPHAEAIAVFNSVRGWRSAVLGRPQRGTVGSDE